MPTLIVQTFASEDHPGSMARVVDEGFDEVLERVFSLVTERTAEEHRGNRIYHIGGRRCLIYPENVFYMEEQPLDEST